MMNNVHILSNEEFEGMIKRIRDLEGDCMWLSHKWETAEERFDALYKEHNREAYEQLDAAHRAELMQWCEEQSAKYEEIDYRAWCEEQANLYNNGIIEACKKYHCEPKDMKYLGWAKENVLIDNKPEGWSSAIKFGTWYEFYQLSKEYESKAQYSTQYRMQENLCKSYAFDYKNDNDDFWMREYRYIKSRSASTVVR